MEVVVRKGNLKWCPTMCENLLDQVLANGAYQRTQNESLETKFRSIALNLWKLDIFKTKGQPISWNTLQHKYGVLLSGFRTTHGLGDDDAKTNISALPEELTTMDAKLYEIHKMILEKKNVDEVTKAEMVEKKKVISDINDVIAAGGGRKGLVDLSLSVSFSSTSASSTGVLEFAAMSKSKKRARSGSEADGDREMKLLRDILSEDNAAIAMMRQIGK